MKYTIYHSPPDSGFWNYSPQFWLKIVTPLSLANYALSLAGDERFFLILAKYCQIFKTVKLLAIPWNILFTTRRQN